MDTHVKRGHTRKPENDDDDVDEEGHGSLLFIFFVYGSVFFLSVCDVYLHGSLSHANETPRVGLFMLCSASLFLMK